MSTVNVNVIATTYPNAVMSCMDTVSQAVTPAGLVRLAKVLTVMLSHCCCQGVYICLYLRALSGVTVFY